MKVTLIKPVKKKKKRSSVYLDGRFAFSLSDKVISKTGIREGNILDKEEIENIIKKEEKKKALGYALLLLTYRPRSISEIYSKLEGKGYDGDIIRKATEKLKSEGKLGDRDFSRWWIRQRRSGRPKGDIAIKAELKSKGVKEKIIDEALCEANENRSEDELELAWRACRTRLDGYRGLPRTVAARRLGALLKRRGFSFEVINKVLDKFFNRYYGE